MATVYKAKSNFKLDLANIKKEMAKRIKVEVKPKDKPKQKAE